MKSFLLNIRVPAPLLAALEKFIERRAFPAFARNAIAEKLARDFGEQLDASALAVRVGQGRRTDLERRRAELARERAEWEATGARELNETLKLPPKEIKAAREKIYARGNAIVERQMLLVLDIVKARAEAGDKAAARALRAHSRASKAYDAGKATVEELNAAFLRLAEIAGVKVESGLFQFPAEKGAGAAGVPAPKPRRGSGDKTAGK